MPELSDVLGDASSLTRIQLETLKIQLALRKSSISLDEALKIRKGGRIHGGDGISRGTHYRILAQAKKNMRRSMFTVAAMVNLGISKPEDLQRLLAAMSALPVEVDEERLREVAALVNALVDRIVML